MARRRFFVDSIRNGTAEISGDEARHLTQVLRVETGHLYEISDNREIYLAEVTLARKQHVIFEVREDLGRPREGPAIALYLALIKFDHLELAIEKATELGVTHIHTVITDRSEHGLERAAEKRIARWRRIAVESSQQSRRGRLPEIYEPVRMRQALRAEAAIRLFLDEARTGVPLLPLVTPVQSYALLVGPEGGWTDGERDEARSAGWTAATLGEGILRAETAAIAALSVIRAVLTGREVPVQ